MLPSNFPAASHRRLVAVSRRIVVYLMSLMLSRTGYLPLVRTVDAAQLSSSGDEEPIILYAYMAKHIVIHCRMTAHEECIRGVASDSTVWALVLGRFGQKSKKWIWKIRSNTIWKIRLNTILIRRILLSEPCTVIFRICSALSCCFAMCFKCFGVLFFSVRLISSFVLHVRLTCVY